MVTVNASNENTAPLGTVLQGQGVGNTSAFSTATYPSLSLANNILCSTANNVVGQIPNGTTGQVLTATTAGFPSWQPNPGAGSIVGVNTQVFVASGTYTPSVGMVQCAVQIVGGGGAGGGAPNTGTNSIGAGGGAGEYAYGVFDAATIGVSQPVTIGAGGIPNNGAAGGNAGTSSLGILITAFGGRGGGTAPSSLTIFVLGGLGGTGGAGGNYRITGNYGGSASNGATTNLSGYGGNSFFGAGALGNSVASTFTSVPGFAGLGHGSGGGGASNDGGGAGSQPGGAGTSGIIIITEYIS